MEKPEGEEKEGRVNHTTKTRNNTFMSRRQVPSYLELINQSPFNVVPDALEACNKVCC